MLPSHITITLLICFGIFIIFTTIMFSIVAYKIIKREPYIYNLEELRSWGNSIHLDRPDDTGKIIAHGWISNPYVNKGDFLTYKHFDGTEVKLKFTKVKYCKTPHDMFFAELKPIN
jgi:hypothetical protein